MSKTCPKLYKLSVKGHDSRVREFRHDATREEKLRKVAGLWPDALSPAEKLELENMKEDND